MSDALEALARQAAGDSLFLAAPLARYAASERLDDDALAERLGCPRGVLAELRLCRNPDPLPPRFGEDVQRIAGHFGLDAARLAQVIRFGQGLLRLAQPGPHGDAAAFGCLLAARDRKVDEGSGP